MPDECRRNRPFEKAGEWDGMYFMLRVCKGVSEKCLVSNGLEMAYEEKKDFNAMLYASKDVRRGFYGIH